MIVEAPNYLEDCESAVQGSTIQGFQVIFKIEYDLEKLGMYGVLPSFSSRLSWSQRNSKAFARTDNLYGTYAIGSQILSFVTRKWGIGK